MPPLSGKALLEPPRVAWATLLVGALAPATWLLSFCGAAIGVLPLPVAVVLSSIAAFVSFTPMHDAVHRSVARARWVNEVLGRLCGVPLTGPFLALRFMHLEHHRHTNDPEKDPDHWAGRGPGWALPLRWLTQDLHYYGRYLRRLRHRPNAERLEVLGTFALFIAVGVSLWASGLGREVFWLWLVPARVAITLLSFTFDYLPHRPHQVLGAVDPYRATSIFDSLLLQWLLLCQSHHLIHHLYPAVPFYRYVAVWRDREAELRGKGAQVVLSARSR